MLSAACQSIGRRFTFMGGVSIFLTSALFANVVGSNTQNFNPGYSNEDYFTVSSAKTIDEGQYHLGLFANTAVNTLPYYTNDSASKYSASRTKYNDSITSFDMSVGYGVMKNLDLGVVIPGVLFQHIKDQDSIHGQYAQRGITGFRLGAKYHLIDFEQFHFAAQTSAEVNLTKDNPYDGKNSLPAMNFELVGESFFGPLRSAVNIGYHMQNAKPIGDDFAMSEVHPFGNHYMGSAAVGYQLPNSSTEVIGEMYGSTPSRREFEMSDRHTTRLESLVGARIKSSENLFYNFGAGTELRQSISSPDWRFFAGVRMIMGSPAATTPSVAAPVAPSAPVATNAAFDESRKPDEIITISDVLFKFNSDQMVDHGSRDHLANLVKSLQKPEGFERLVIEGHTCSIGSDRYNMSLSLRRAKKIRSVLIREYGFDSHRITARGLGKRVPIATNKTEEGRKLNRRVEFKIFRPASAPVASTH